MTRRPKGQCSTPDNPCGSKLMLWIAEHMNYAGDDCLIWPFGRDPNGYGSFGRIIDGKRTKIYAHRFMCEARNGPPPSPKHQADHLCNNGYGGCVNPRHLSWATPGENQRRGRRHGRHVLTPEAVADIRKGEHPDQVYADRYGVRATTIQKVRLGQTWKTGKVVHGGFAQKPYRRPASATPGDR